ncbi:nascent polypeptide-associated complex protein [Natronomonas moolapensis 8.8.11]|uniref:Nascent polypeptide-associated complex protein n=1 Tax=Natronomonas moolapensis (strain DSM 18674 / CECT 7526 / JCM 14361 / 8.8.11) TaxID=268739 RepID=M1XLJ4_NATM8|nr:nascent polypeptide-associated complex protein [Natronomonas moolapensis]CCQ37828.1 nascent polypeptide-associated complex protein [Natronomonas moolapensis 8.8.11]
MFGGGGGLNPRKMKQMMNQMGIDLEDIDAEEVIIRTPEEELVFHDAEVQRMDAQGQQTYQVVGDPDTRPRGEAGSIEEADAGSDAEAADDAIESGFSEDDVEIVATRTGVSEAEAREALEETGDLAAAVQKLE